MKTTTPATFHLPMAGTYHRLLERSMPVPKGEPMSQSPTTLSPGQHMPKRSFSPQVQTLRNHPSLNSRRSILQINQEIRKAMWLIRPPLVQLQGTRTQPSTSQCFTHKVRNWMERVCQDNERKSGQIGYSEERRMLMSALGPKLMNWNFVGDSWSLMKCI